MADEKDGNGGITGKAEEIRDRDHWRSPESEQKSLANLRPFNAEHRPSNPGRPKGSGLKKELLKALRQTVPSDPLHRKFVTLIAQAMVKAAAKGNVQAAMFIRDEVDGRLPRPLEGEVPASQVFVQVWTDVQRHNYDWSKLSPEMQGFLPEHMRPPKPQGT
jgi:hypothetical protein